MGLVVQFQHSHAIPASTFANAGIEGPLEIIDSSGALDLTFAFQCATGRERTSNPLHWYKPRSPIMRPVLLLRALTAGLLAACLAGPVLAQEKDSKDAAKDKPQALDKVSFGTNWVAEAEHGGFFRSVADGTYRKYGLDVTIVPGGPQVNNRILVPVGKMDFVMVAGTLQAFDAAVQNVPTVSVAAMFQKDPQVFLT